jgi:quercetin dioxygenase-like cupin family protein
MLLETFMRSKEFNVSMREMQKTLNSIADMIETGDISLPDNRDDNSWVITPIFENTDCSVGTVRIQSSSLRACAPHVHEQSTEYLIVTRGSLLLNIEGRNVRVVAVGECASIPPGIEHSSYPMTEDTEFVYVCVPRDYGIPETVNCGSENQNVT